MKQLSWIAAGILLGLLLPLHWMNSQVLALVSQSRLVQMILNLFNMLWSSIFPFAETILVGLTVFLLAFALTQLIPRLRTTELGMVALFALAFALSFFIKGQAVPSISMHRFCHIMNSAQSDLASISQPTQSLLAGELMLFAAQTAPNPSARKWQASFAQTADPAESGSYWQIDSAQKSTYIFEGFKRFGYSYKNCAGANVQLLGNDLEGIDRSHASFEEQSH